MRNLRPLRSGAAAPIDEAARLEKLLSSMEGALQAVFRQFVRSSTTPQMMAAVSALLERGDIEGALALVRGHIEAASTIFPSLFTAAADAEAEAIIAQIQPVFAVSFDPGMPEAAALMRRNQLEFVQALDDSQKAATREAMAQGLVEGQGLIATADSFKASIGLSPGQVNAVVNYRRLLRQNSAGALDRALRDQRFDPLVENAVAGRQPLTDAQIDRMVDAYWRRSLAFRAETIARTESIRVLSQAQEETFRQAMARGQVDPQDVECAWNTNMDGRERATHGAMNGQVRAFGAPFDSPSGAQLRYPGDPMAPAEETINCRCRRTFRIILSGMARQVAA